MINEDTLPVKKTGDIIIWCFQCPKCKASWRGPPIPKKYRGSYGKGATHYSRLIGVEIRGGYDGVSYWECPDCHETFDRIK
jgi:ssDNA-binding Zn-finger/Zn-ribbon topoisomerase 1